MVFTSLQFLFLFFPIVFIGYWLIKLQYANAWLLFSSLVFYYIGDRAHLKLLLFVITIAYVAGVLIFQLKSKKIKKITVIGAVALMMLIMTYYKYWDFMIANINNFFHRNLIYSNIIFPIGISFFIFQAISYIVDIYKGERPLKNPIDTALYISFFPQLIAGPIVRFSDIRECLEKENRKIDIQNLENGIWRFCLGMSKKILLANNLAGLADIVFGVRDISQFSVLYTWLGAIAYALQIYFDFSGYSDMAIGLGRIFGFKFQENFNYPYIAKSVKDFWRRWHISLSLFFRDYVYIPLGGNRRGRSKWFINMLFVWLLTGLWHGAAWNYIFWGGSYGIILIIEQLLNQNNRKTNSYTSVLGHIYTIIVIVLLWVVFRADNLIIATKYIKNMFGVNKNVFIDKAFMFQAENYLILIVISIILCLPLEKICSRKYINYIKMIGLICCTISSISFIYMGSYNPFLYFMF